MNRKPGNIETVLKAYTTTKDAELELRFDANQIKKDWYINMLQTGITKGDASFEQSINLISNTSNGYNAHRIMYVDGKKQPNTLMYAKNVVTKSDWNKGLVPYRLVLATERQISKIGIPSMARIKLRLSVNNFPKLDGWRIDFTFTKSVKPVTKSEIVIHRDNLFKKYDLKTFITDAPWTDAERYEVEVEYIGSSTPTEENVQHVANTIYGIISPDHTQIEGYQSVIYKVAKLIFQPRRAELFKMRYGLKHLFNAVKEMSRSDYFTVIFPNIQQYYVTIKADGERVIGFAQNKTLTIIGHDVKVVQLDNAVNGDVVVDAEFVDGKLMIFDVLVINGINISVKSFNERFEYIKAAVAALGKKNTIAKQYVKLTSNWSQEIKSIWNAKYEGLIFNSATGSYSKMEVWKWKTVESMSVDSITMVAPPKFVETLPVNLQSKPNTTTMILFCSIWSNQFKSSHLRRIPFYNEIFPSQSTHEIFPIQFSTPDNPHAYLYYHPDDEKVSVKDLHGHIGEYNYNASEQLWTLMRIRSDRDVDVQRGTYFGNNYAIALLIWNNFQNPLTITNIIAPDPSTMGYFAKHDSDEHRSVRSFNSYVKQQVMEMYFRNTPWLVDLAAGKGQDMFRMSKMGVQNAVLVDNDHEALSTISSRMFSYNKSVGQLKTRIYTKHLDLLAPYLNNVNTLKMIPKVGVPSIMCNLAIHYFMGSERNMTNIVNMVIALLNKDDGTFMFTCFNGKAVHNMLHKKKEGDSIDFIDNEITKFSIKRMYTSNQLMQTAQKIGVVLPFSNHKYYEEYLVNIDNLLSKFRNNGFKVSLNKSFESWLETYETNNPRGFAKMTDNDKKFVSLYQAVVVQRHTPRTKGGGGTHSREMKTDDTSQKNPLVVETPTVGLGLGLAQIHTMSIRSKWYNHIKNGSKTVEGRLNRGKYANINIGDIITFMKINHPNDVLRAKVVNIEKYNTFEDMFGVGGIDVPNMLPGIESPTEAVQLFHNVYTPDTVDKYGTIAIHVCVM
jgi:ASC-1-like (ASCH) protein